MKKVREENIPLINYVSEIKDGDVSDDQDVQRYFCSDKAFINGIAVTVLTEDYLPPLILAEVPLNEDIVQKYVVDGLQRTTALMQIRYGNYKFTGSMEDNEIEYQTKKLDEDGKFLKDENGNFVWEKKVFDIKGKTFDEFPKELKKRFDNYQIKTATYQNCTMQKVSKLVRKLNVQRGMNTSQQALTWIPTYARKVKNIADCGFFKNSIEYSDNKRKNGEYMQIVCRSVMDIFHFDKYKRGAKDVCFYLEDNSNINEFNIVQDYFNRLERICGENFKAFFANKDIPVWLTVFDKFTKSGLEDKRFADFLAALRESLHSKVIGEDSYDILYKATGTTDKKLVDRKITLYTTLMNEFLHIDTTEVENNMENTQNCHENDTEIVTSEDETILDFVKETVDEQTDEEDIALYEDMLNDCVRIDSPVYQQCQKALIALMAYACGKENDDRFADWVSTYKNTTNFSNSQKINFDYMKRSFDKYVSA